MARATQNAEDLNGHLSKLPQEIYDDIYDLVFTVVPVVEKIDENYKLPVQLQISRPIRAKFAGSYYGGDTTFQLRENASRWSCNLYWADLAETCDSCHEDLAEVYDESRAVIAMKHVHFGPCFVPRERYYVAHTIKKIMEDKLNRSAILGDMRFEVTTRTNGHFEKMEFEPKGLLDREGMSKVYC